jgi:hypothetical protein
MNWIRHNLFFVAFIIVFAGLLGFEVLVQQKATANLRQIKVDLEQQTGQLKSVLSAKIPPSGEALRAYQQRRQEAEGVYQELLKVAGMTVSVTDVSNVEFHQKLSKTLHDLRQRTMENDVQTPANFAFGFSRYMATLPGTSPENLRLLSKQLLVIDRLTKMLVARRVEAIRNIRRVEVEPGSRSLDAMEGSVTIENQLCRRLPFEIQFVCTTDSLRAFLNDLSRAKWFFTIRNLSIQTEKVTESIQQPGQDLRLLPEGGFDNFDPGRVPPTGRAPRTATNPKSADRNRLVVTMRIDLIELLSPEERPKS